MTITCHIVLRSEGNVPRFYFNGIDKVPGHVGWSRACAEEILELQGLTFWQRQTALVNAEAALGYAVRIPQGVAS